MSGSMKVCVFCGAKLGQGSSFRQVAERTGTLLARAGATLVYGGGSVGMMGVLADAAIAEGGSVIGIIPQLLMRREVGHARLDRLEVVSDMQVRKQRMIEISDAFVALPGGLGTLDEVFEVLTLRQLGLHTKPMLLVDQDGYFGTLTRSLQEFVDQGLVRPEDLAALETYPTPEAALARLGLRPLAAHP